MTRRKNSRQSTHGEWIQKYSLLVALIGTPSFAVAKIMHAGPHFFIWSGALLIFIFSASLASTLYSGIAYGSNFERIERKAQPNKFWLMVSALVFACFTGAFCISQGLSGYIMK